MSRWEPNTRARLERASLDLFTERGYDATTVAEITERAGLTKRTFFRYFADKREVLFGGQEILSRLLIDGITGAPGTATPFDVITAALEALTPAFPPERLDLVRQRQAIVAAHQDLRERELLKGTTLTAAMADGFRQRGLAEPVVNVAAQLGSLALSMTFARWVASTDDEKFADLARDVVAELRTAAAALDRSTKDG
jgi:AcrR family transcriptional regulator